ncbi:MAG: hypothetical protein HZB65_04490 [Candidatus Aenigmarchaeota archaeon]|nr:hypothetical protein [Candidatus Aenigmarchaeota archaeon]
MKNVCKLFAGTALVLFVLAEGIFMVPEKMKKVYVNWFDKQYSMIEQNYTEKTHRKELNYVISLISSFDKKDYTITHDSSSQLPDSVKSLNPGIQGHEDTYSFLSRKEILYFPLQR